MAETAKEYYEENGKFMIEYEEAVRDWLSKDYKRPNGRKTFKGNPELAQKIPFFRDGVVCPEVWFEKGNDFRPLIILKEVSLGIDKEESLNDYLKIWGNTKHFDFVTYPFNDVRIGTFPQWRRNARLIRMLESVHNNEPDFDYNVYDLSFKHSGEFYSGKIEGYYDKRNFYERTGNEEYRRITDRMAIMEIKKIGGGVSAGSEISVASRYFADHVIPFKDLLKKQIELINPTVVICCGRENGKCIRDLFSEIENEISKDILWIESYHHIYSTNEKFFDEPREIYKEYISKKK